LKVVFAQLTKQIFGYLCSQGNKFLSVDTYNLLKDLHVYKNFLHLIGVELWKDWEKDFTEDPKKKDKNTKEFQLLEENNIARVL